jgi:S1-C subfamily serine protease
MRRMEDFDRRPWMIVPVLPGMERSYQRWNIALISALVFLVVGVFVMTLTPELGHAAAGAHKATLPGYAVPGVEVENLTPASERHFDLTVGTLGVLVASVDSGSTAAAAGLQRGDVIQEVDHKEVNNVTEFAQALSEEHGRPALLQVERGGSMHYMVLQEPSER